MKFNYSNDQKMLAGMLTKAHVPFVSGENEIRAGDYDEAVFQFSPSGMIHMYIVREPDRTNPNRLTEVVPKEHWRNQTGKFRRFWGWLWDYS